VKTGSTLLFINFSVDNERNKGIIIINAIQILFLTFLKQILNTTTKGITIKIPIKPASGLIRYAMIKERRAIDIISDFFFFEESLINPKYNNRIDEKLNKIEILVKEIKYILLNETNKNKINNQNFSLLCFKIRKHNILNVSQFNKTREIPK
jgi:hypothetical protein